MIGIPAKSALCILSVFGMMAVAKQAPAAALKMTYNSDWPPYSTGIGGKVDGILPILMTEIVKKRMGMDIQNNGYPWKRAQRFVEIGQADAFVTVPTDARLAFANSSKQIVYAIKMHPVVVSGGPAEKKLSDTPHPKTLKKLSLCDIIGNGWGKAFAKRNNLSPLMATKVAACLRMIVNGRTQVSVQALAVLNQALSAEEFGNRLNVLPHSFGEMKFTLLLSKKSAHGTDFLEKFDATLEKMIADGSYADLVNRLRTGTYR